MSKSIEFANPDGLLKNPAFSQVAVTKGQGSVIYIGGQNAITMSVGEEHNITGRALTRRNKAITRHIHALTNYRPGSARVYLLLCCSVNRKAIINTFVYPALRPK